MGVDHSVQSGCLVPVLAVLKARLASVGGKTGISQAKKATKKIASTAVAQSSESISKLIKAVSRLPGGSYPNQDILDEVSAIGTAVIGQYKIPVGRLVTDFVNPDVDFDDFFGKRQLYFKLSEPDIWKAAGEPKKCLVDLCSFIGIDPKEVAHQTWVLILP